MTSDADDAATRTPSVSGRRVLDQGIAALRPELRAAEARIRAAAGRRAGHDGIVRIGDGPFGARVPDAEVASTPRVDARELNDEDTATEAVERFLRDLDGR